METTVVCGVYRINPCPLMGIMIGILILRPLKRGDLLIMGLHRGLGFVIQTSYQYLDIRKLVNRIRFLNSNAVDGAPHAPKKGPSTPGLLVIGFGRLFGSRVSFRGSRCSDHLYTG